ncbi:MAG TPA: TadE family protein [Pyrinomonadaceae bacterium]|nr:TadE family protein [Pyrinomonadaceae bacterium]
MRQSKRFKSNEQGATLVEFSIAALVFLTVMFGVIEFGRALWVHNALADAARRGARYAALHSPDDIEQVRNVVVYGDEDGGDTPMIPNLSTDDVSVNYTNFAVNGGTVTVSIDEYEFQFVVPIIGTTITMPSYSTTLPGECIGFIPDPI